MTSPTDSSKRNDPSAPFSEIESLAGAFHPHAIEVQDFSYYALVIDVRNKAAYDDDHIPGAVQLVPLRPGFEGADFMAAAGPLDSGQANELMDDQRELPAVLAALVAPIKRDQAILLYCGRGGLDSQPVAQALRWRGWTVDVLSGGWINYRRWVLAGLELLPRLVTFRVIASSLGSETARVLNVLRELGHQVLDVEGLAGARNGALLSAANSQPRQPPQAWFESQLLHALRGLQGSSPVWVTDTARTIGNLVLPGAWSDAIARAPTTRLEMPPDERLRCWREDEALLEQEPEVIVNAVAALQPWSNTLLLKWTQLAATGFADQLLLSLLTEGVDASYAKQAAMRDQSRHALPAIRIESMLPEPLKTTVQSWLSAGAAGQPSI